MKKAVNITLNSIVFQLEEDAYKRLDGYLESIKKHYKSSLGGEEILKDIESSLAQKFSLKIKSKNQAIALSDVEEAIVIMGTVEEIDDEEVGETDENKEEGSETHKRLYRNSDDVIIAGVCSGVAAYLNIDVIFVRLLFVVLALIDGVGILIYAILWIIVPEAKTSAEKLEMQGKPVNLAEIQEVVREKSKMIKKEGKRAWETLSKNKSTFYKVLNFPIQVLARVVYFLRKTLKVVGPTLSILIGVVLTASFLVAILGLTVALGVMIFYIDSPYVVSDLPLSELSGQGMYYLGAVSVYFIALVPVIFLLILGFTMVRRKNNFRPLLSGLLLTLWMIAIAMGLVAAGDLAPQIYSRMEEINKKETVVKEYDVEDFSKLYIRGNQEIKVKQGDEFSVSFSGREEDLERMSFEIEEGQLQIVQNKRKEDNKLCIFCFNRLVTGEIVMPKLDSFVGTDTSRTEIEGFADGLYISMGESAVAKMNLAGQSVKAKLSGVNSRLELSGEAERLEIEMDGHANLVLDGFKGETIEIDQSVFSRSVMDGETGLLKAKISDYAKLSAFNLKANICQIKASDRAEGDVWVEGNLEIIRDGSSRVDYIGQPGNLIKNVFSESNAGEDGDKYINIDDTGEIVYPVREFDSRITKKSFGMYITPKTSPVQPERFSGYHTGVDVEYADVVDDVRAVSVAEGEVVFSGWVSGYGGVVAIEQTIDGEEYLVIYGHLDPKSLIDNGSRVWAGREIGILGEGETDETDGERKHLHFGVYSGDDLNLKGYAESQDELGEWVDPLILF